MPSKKAICLLFIFTALTISSFAQRNDFQNLYFIQKKKSEKPNPNWYLPNSSGFYIYRNCIYDFIKRNKEQVKARVIDIRNDSIYYVPYFNKEVAAKYGVHFDTLRLYPSEIKMIRRINTGLFATNQSVSLARYKFGFEQSDTAKRFETKIKTVFNTDSGRYVDYELVPYATGNYDDTLYEQGGQLHLYPGRIKHSLEDTVVYPAKNEHRQHNFIWYTPSGANKINGIHISLQTMNTNDQPIIINGLSCSADALGAFIVFYAIADLGAGSMMVNLPDTLTGEKTYNQMNGLSISGGGQGDDDMTMNGISLNGGVCLIHKANGLVITGTQNMQDAFNGVVIAGLRNKAIKGRGIQIGGLNSCKNLKGIQIGLWNINSRRSLPFINWCFKPKIKA